MPTTSCVGTESTGRFWPRSGATWEPVTTTRRSTALLLKTFAPCLRPPPNRIEDATAFPSQLREVAARGPGCVTDLLTTLPDRGITPAGEAPLAAIALASDPTTDPDTLVGAAASAGGSELA